MTNLIRQAKRWILSIVVFATFFAVSAVPAIAQTTQSDAFECQNQENVSPALIAQAQACLQEASGTSALAETGADTEPSTDNAASLFPQGQELGLSTCGKARAIVIRVSFPASEDGSEAAQTIPVTETDEDLLAAFNGEADMTDATYPYESLYAYYLRSSYGKLDFKSTQVVSYTAQHPRSYYESMERSVLFYEALTQIDDQVDFTQCDANNDGYIDAVYLQFAGNCGAWASTWWPQEASCTQAPSGMQETFDGKKVCACVLMDTLEAEVQRSGSDNTVLSFKRTLIHETGHVLGLPDLYSYGNNKGTGSIDMMDVNFGDQNGLFKWLLGWITPDQITYVYTSSAGVDVRHGMGTVTHYDNSATLDLLPYTTDESWEDTGGFIAVSSDKSILDGNLFCNFHLLVFDQPAANMTINLNNYPVNLGHGVRAFRIQAGLNDDKTNFAVTNTDGTSGNQLYEALRPVDGDDSSAVIEFGDFWHLGALISPSTKPSTNYFNSQEAGHTGITFEIVGETDTSAQVKFSWTPASEAREFTLTPTADSILDGFSTLTFNATWAAPMLGAEVLAVHLLVDGNEVPAVAVYNQLFARLTVTALLNPGIVLTGSSAELVVDAGFFNLGIDEQGQARTSPELRIPVSVPTATVSVESSGTYTQTGATSDSTIQTSDVCVDPDGRAYFFQATSGSSGDTLQLFRVSESGDEVTAFDLECGEDYWNASGINLQAVDLGDGTAFLQVRSPSAYADGSIAGRDLWVKVSSGKVLASKEVDAKEDGATFFSTGDGCVAYIQTGQNYERSLVVMSRADSKVSTNSYALTLPSQVDWVEEAGNAGDGYIYAVQNGQRADGEKATMVLWRVADLVAAGKDGAAAAAACFTVSDNNRVMDVKVAGEKIYLACETIDRSEASSFIDELRVYGFDGKRVSTTTISPYCESTAQIKVSESGAVAWITNTEVESTVEKATVQSRVVIYDPSDGSLSQMGVLGPAHGAWLKSRWLEVDRDLAAFTDGYFGDMCQRWSLTKEFGTAEVDPEPEPDPTPEPEPEPDPEPEPTPDPEPTPNPEPDADTTPETTPTEPINEKTTDKSAKLPTTGDTTSNLVILLAAGALLTAYGAVLFTKSKFV